MRRRTFLVLGAAAGGLAATGAVLLANGYRSWVLRSLEQALPGYSFNAAGLDLFLEEYKPRHSDAMKFQAFGAAETVFDARALLPDSTIEYIGDEERDVLTEFLIGSDFFQQAPDGPREITYSGRAVACRSPFATFDS